MGHRRGAALRPGLGRTRHQRASQPLRARPPQLEEGLLATSSEPDLRMDGADTGPALSTVSGTVPGLVKIPDEVDDGGYLLAWLGQVSLREADVQFSPVSWIPRRCNTQGLAW